MVEIVLNGLKAIYKPSFGDQKCGVQPSAIRPAASPSQFDIFDLRCEGMPPDNAILMRTLDTINRRFPEAVTIASSSFDNSWKPKAERISQRYTTDRRELAAVR